MESSEIVETLKKCDLFKYLDDEELNRVANLCTIVKHGAGKTIFGQGQRGDRLYVLSKGQVSLHRKYKLHDSRMADAVVYVLRETSSRRLIGGWCALVGKDHVYMSSAKCDKASRLIAIDGKHLRDFIVARPDIRIKIIEKLVLLLRGRLESVYDSFESV
jgi:CRP-like cAMP-binding protein